MKIIGAGMAGLLCGVLNPGSTIIEKNDKPKRTHKALFRCKSGELSKLTGVPFEEVLVHKAIWSEGKECLPTPRLIHQYSFKVTGEVSSRSIFDISTTKRFIPPEDFINQLIIKCNIQYGQVENFIHRSEEPIVSTVPMDKITHNGGVALLNKKSIFSTQVRLSHCDSNCTIYYPDLNNIVYRASVIRDVLIVESISEIVNDDIYVVLVSMGLHRSHIASVLFMNNEQKYGKITPMDESKRKEFITNFTIQKNVYSLGRFATWRPKVMLDDVLDDIFVIRRLIQGGNYASLNHHQKGK